MLKPFTAKIKTHRRCPFSILEMLIAIGILSVLISTFSYLGYDALQEFRKRNGRKAFKEYITSLHHKNALVECYLMVLIEQEGDFVKTTLGGYTNGIDDKDKKRSFYVGKLFAPKSKLALTITPQAIPKNEELTSWIEKNDCSLRFKERA